MRLSTFSNISVVLLLPLILTGCLIERKNINTPTENVNAQAATNTSWDQQEIGGIESNPTSHFRFNFPAALKVKTDTPELIVFEKDSREVLRISSFAGTKEKVKQRIASDFSSTPSVTTSTEKPWDVYTTGILQNQVLAFADGANGVIMSFQDVPDNIIKAIQDSFEFTSPSLKLTPFTNTKYKYSVSYPSNYQLFATNDDRSEPAVSSVVHLSILPTSGDITIEVHEFAKGETFASYLKSTHGLDSTLTDSFKINGLTAYVYNGTMTTQRVGVINANGKAIIFTYEDGSRSEDIMQAFDNIMKSFKLL